MEPLSIAASVVGLLGAAAKISSILTTLLRKTRDAPEFAHNVLREVTDISTTLAQLQEFLVGTRVGQRSRTETIMVEQVIIILTTCVMSFSELEEAVTSLQSNSFNEPLWAKLKWAKKEATMMKLLSRLSSSRLSLNLMLTTLIW